MSQSEQTKNAASEDASVKRECQAEFIFYAQTHANRSKPVKILGEYGCDYRRPDWEHRWKTWDSRQDPYLHLFLCKEHATKLGLMD